MCAMRSCFGASIVLDERSLDSLDLSVGAADASNYVSRQLRRRDDVAARCAPKQVISMPLVYCGYQSYFESFQESCLWVRKEMPDESGEMWYSPYFQAVSI